MSNQDDLELEYKSASDELPSKLTDQIILQAAKDAVTPDKKSSNVVKGKFSSRKWHTPVSIAAAAVITVSVVTSLQPWEVITVNSPTPLMSQEPQMEEMLFDSTSVESDKAQLREKEVLLTQQRTEQKADHQAYKKRAKAVADVAQIAPTRMQTASAPSAQKQKSEESFDDEIFLEAEQTALPEALEMAPLVVAEKIKSLSILEWLDEIETDIRNKDATKAKEKSLMLTKQHSLESFSEQEDKRFKIIQTYLIDNK
ncbi:MAG: hypothetical protein GY829_02545 [Gammaproteobacteria bacterium]|nr:hypothetical protein [Gammaproteobacteria bacterium]